MTVESGDGQGRKQAGLDGRKTTFMCFMAALSALVITVIVCSTSGIGHPADVWFGCFSAFFIGATTQDFINDWKG